MRRARALSILAVGVLAGLGPSAALARRPPPITVRMPAFEVPARSDREVCTFIPLRTRKALNVARLVLTNQGGGEGFASHHMLVYVFAGDPNALAPYRGTVVDDTGCLNLGPRDPTLLRLLGTSQSVRANQPLPRGTALRLEPAPFGAGRATAVGIVLNSHWINGSERARRARVKVKLVLADERAVERQLKPIFEVSANAFIRVPPGGTGSVGWNWGPGLPDLGAHILSGANNPTGPACVTMLVSHMHRRGTLFTVERIDRDDVVTPLYRNTYYDEPPALNLDPPLLVRTGEVLHYRCTHDNATDPRLGCEETPGVAPGRSVLEEYPRLDLAAKVCLRRGPSPEECPPSDPAYPDRTFTGTCVEANLVFGFRSWDEMCILPGYYYDADPAAPAGRECAL